MRSWFALFRFFSRGSLCWISPSQIDSMVTSPFYKALMSIFQLGLKAWILLMKAIVIYRSTETIFIFISQHNLLSSTIFLLLYYILYLSACIELLLTWLDLQSTAIFLWYRFRFRFRFRFRDALIDLLTSARLQSRRQTTTTTTTTNQHKDRFFFNRIIIFWYLL